VNAADELQKVGGLEPGAGINVPRSRWISFRRPRINRH
jgi:hypothetical protein